MARKLTRPRCYHGHDAPARKGSHFCSNVCAAEWAEAMIEGNDSAWCPTCRDWVDASLHTEHETVSHC